MNLDIKEKKGQRGTRTLYNLFFCYVCFLSFKEESFYLLPFIFNP
jgi:hypothetical protein